MHPLVKFTDFNKLSLLNKAYHKTGKYECYVVINTLNSKLKGFITEIEYKQICDKLHIKTDLLEGYDFPAISASYGRLDGIFYILYTEPFTNQLKLATKDDIGLFVDNLWTAYVHEDTHRQQNKNIEDNIKLELNKNYVKYINFDPMNLDLIQNIKYYNQVEEADAYGREVGSRLLSQNKGLSSSNILEMLTKGDISDKYILNLYKIYKDPKISDDATKHFFRAIFDFLENNETV